VKRNLTRNPSRHKVRTLPEVRCENGAIPELPPPHYA
jgi:hypothetical protein